MLASFAKKIFGSSNDRRLKGFAPKVAAINALEPEIAKLSDDEIRAQTDKFRAELAAGPHHAAKAATPQCERRPR